MDFCDPGVVTCPIFVMMKRKQARYFIEPVIHILFWVGIYYVLDALTNSTFRMVSDHSGMVFNRPRMVPDHPGTDTQLIEVVNRFPHLEIVLGFLLLLFYGSVFWFFKKAIRYRSGVKRVAVITGWLVLLFAGNYLLIRGLVGSSGAVPPPRVSFSIRSDAGPSRDSLPLFPEQRIQLPERFSSPNAEKWGHIQLVIALLFLTVLGVAAAYFFIGEWIRNDLMRSQVEARQLSTEIKFLRSQVNPHFLFNTLNNLFSMAQKKGNEELADGISKLSGMMRYMIHESNTDHVSLQREVAYLEDCIVLSKLRYAESEVLVSFSYPLPGEIVTVQVAPMLFIPFLENAFKHGVAIGRISFIALAIAVDSSKLIFTCENTDHSVVRKLEEDKGGIGLENVKRRLELVYPGRHSLRAWVEDDTFKVNLQIDLL
jgi:two-component system LytT family sensor kinase